ncbi:MAG: Rrf2 family transcriptional regulator [Bacteroidota bacterium]|jgi:Rrf2 family protein
MLSKKTQYAIKALMYMAEKNSSEPILISEISKKKKISLKFLENILLTLRKAGFLNSKKGKGGGYTFNMKPEEITIAMILRVVEGPIALLPCASLHFYEKCKNCEEKHCGLNVVMCEVRDASLGVLEHRTVRDLVDLG